MLLAAVAAALAGWPAGCLGGSGPLVLPAAERYERSQPGEFVAASARAQELLNERRDADALPHLRAAVEAAPDNVPTHLLFQDTALRVGGDAEAAMRAYYRDLDDRRGSPVVPFCRARLEADAQSRMRLLDEALKRDPSFYFAYLSRARILRGMHRLDLARAALETAVSARPEHPETRLELGEVLLEMGHAQAAEPHLLAYVQARPEDRLVAKTYAQLLLYRLHQPARARKILESLLREDEEDPGVLMDLAAAAWQEQRLDDAIAGYHRVLEMDRTQSPRAALNLGNLYYEAGRQAGGEARRSYWQRARKAFEFFLSNAGNRTEGLYDSLDFHFAVPYRLDEIAAEIGGDDGAAPAPGVNF